jgi:hypothetical protein
MWSGGESLSHLVVMNGIERSKYLTDFLIDHTTELGESDAGGYGRKEELCWTILVRY